MNNILVTGGCGFIGSNWIIRNYKKFNILNVDNLSIGSDLNNLNEITSSNYSFLKMSITDPFLCEYVDARDFIPDAIINFAAESHVDRSIATPLPFFNTNVIGTVNLLDLLLKLNPNGRFLHISTDEVFGHLQPSDPPFDESSHYNPRSPYSASKASAEMAVKAYNQTYGLDTVISNTCNNFGPRQFKEKFIPTIIEKILQGKNIPVYGNGLNIREWISVYDNCDGITNILLNGKKSNSYCLGSNVELTNLDLIKNIISIFNELNINTSNSKINFIEDRKGHDFRYAINSSKAKNELNWSCKYDFKPFLKETILWYLNKS
jgi:dTDP-glucose 4,6-dehydratase